MIYVPKYVNMYIMVKRYTLAELGELWVKLDQPKLTVPDFLQYIAEMNDDEEGLEEILDPGSEADQLAGDGGPEDD